MTQLYLHTGSHNTCHLTNREMFIFVDEVKLKTEFSSLRKFGTPPAKHPVTVTVFKNALSVDSISPSASEFFLCNIGIINIRFQYFPLLCGGQAEMLS